MSQSQAQHVHSLLNHSLGSPYFGPDPVVFCIARIRYYLRILTLRFICIPNFQPAVGKRCHAQRVNAEAHDLTKAQFHNPIKKEKKRNDFSAVGHRYIHLHESWIHDLCASVIGRIVIHTQHMKVLDVKSSAKQKKRCQSTIISGTAAYSIICSVVNPKRQKKKLLTRARASARAHTRSIDEYTFVRT